MPAISVREVLAKLFDELKQKFPTAKTVNVAGQSVSGGDPIPPRPGLIMSDCQAAVVMSKIRYCVQLAVLTAPNIDFSTGVTDAGFNGKLILTIMAGPFRVEPARWEIGKGYFCRDDIKIHSGGMAISAFLPTSELSGYLIARVHQLTKELAPVAQEVWEVSLWPNGDYEHRPAHLPPQDMQKG